MAKLALVALVLILVAIPQATGATILVSITDSDLGYTPIWMSDPAHWWDFDQPGYYSFGGRSAMWGDKPIYTTHDSFTETFRVTNNTSVPWTMDLVQHEYGGVANFHFNFQPGIRISYSDYNGPGNAKVDPNWGGNLVKVYGDRRVGTPGIPSTWWQPAIFNIGDSFEITLSGQVEPGAIGPFTLYANIESYTTPEPPSWLLGTLLLAGFCVMRRKTLQQRLL